MSLTHCQVYLQRATDSSVRYDRQASNLQKNHINDLQQTATDHPNIVHHHRSSQLDSANHQTPNSTHRQYYHPKAGNPKDFDHSNDRLIQFKQNEFNQNDSNQNELNQTQFKPNDSNQNEFNQTDYNQKDLNDSNHPNHSNHSNQSNEATNLRHLNHRRSLLYRTKCLAGYLLIYLLISCAHLAQAAPLTGNVNLFNLNEHLNANPLNQFLKEPDLVKVYKDRVIFHIFPLAKKEIEIR